MQDRANAVPLCLMAAHPIGEGVQKSDLAASFEKGFRGVSILREQLNAAGPSAGDIVESHCHGNYELSAKRATNVAPPRLLKPTDTYFAPGLPAI